MRKLKGPEPPEGTLEAALRRLKASPDSTNDLIAARLLLDARVMEIAKECGGKTSLQALARSALAKSRANEEMSELEMKVMVVLAAVRVFAEIDNSG